MTQEEIKLRLHKLRYEGKWSIAKLASEFGLPASTIRNAMLTKMSARTQARLSAALPLVADHAPIVHRISKHKPGHFKRYVIRYFNLMGWLDVIEQEPGITKSFYRRRYPKETPRDVMAFVCAKLDYQMKHHLLELFGERLKQKKITMGDCYAAEKWIERIRHALPRDRPALFAKIIERRGLKKYGKRITSSAE